MAPTSLNLPLDDPAGAFCRENHVALDGTGVGPLAGLTFAAKDVFHIAGVRTGFGSPSWLATHEPATHTAEAVERLLNAGASMVGKTHSDELAYSLTGENVHYGTPLNSRAPDRIPGGSSNGSAAAVAAGLVNFSIGTDCGGSVRLPASYCGILGMRPTVDRVPVDGVIPFGPPFDVVGWFANDADLLEAIGRILMDDDSAPPPPRRLLRTTDAFALVDDAVTDALAPAIARVADAIGGIQDATVAPEGLGDWFETFRVLQAASIWSNHGDWITRTRPAFGPGVKERFEWAAALAPARGDPRPPRRNPGGRRPPGPADLAPRRAAQELAHRRHRDPLPPPGHASLMHRRPRRPAANQPADGGDRRPAARAVAGGTARFRYPDPRTRAGADGGGRVARRSAACLIFATRRSRASEAPQARLSSRT
jgi:amidase